MIRKLYNFLFKKNKIVYCVVADTSSAHEAECVYSIFESEILAAKEINRLILANVSAGCYDGKFYIKPVALNCSSDNWIC